MRLPYSFAGTELPCAMPAPPVILTLVFFSFFSAFSPAFHCMIATFFIIRHKNHPAQRLWLFDYYHQGPDWAAAPHSAQALYTQRKARCTLRAARLCQEQPAVAHAVQQRS